MSGDVVELEEMADEDCGSWRCFGGKDSILLQKAFVKGTCSLVFGVQWHSFLNVRRCSRVGPEEIADEDSCSGHREKNSLNGKG